MSWRRPLKLRMPAERRDSMVQKVMKEMIAYYAGDPARIQHFLKVYEFSRMIGRAEGLDDGIQLTLELAALVHDIGIRPSEAIYGDCKGPHQEELGPAEVKKMLEPLGVEPKRIERIMYLVGHHHTYKNIEGMDYQILVEADFLVNLHEEGVKKEAVLAARRNIFRTETGTWILNTMFGLEE